MNPLFSYLYHLCIDGPDRWYPLIGVYYLTYRCDFRCPYCSDGQEKPYYGLRSSILPADKVLELLHVMRNHCSHLVLTGGEPLKHDELPQILDNIKQLKFQSVILTTNGFELQTIEPILNDSLTHLVVSIDTLNEQKADQWHGIGGGSSKQIRFNLERAANISKRKFEIIVSSVVTPHNISDLYDVYAYAKEHRFRFAACPQLVGVKAHGELNKNLEYQKFYNFLISEKRKGCRIQGTINYLESMRDLSKFHCHPFTMLVVSPTGEVFYPCLEKGNFAGNLLEEPDLHRIRKMGLDRFGPQPACGTQCHSACALGFASLLEQPLSAIREAYLIAKGKLLGF